MNGRIHTLAEEAGLYCDGTPDAWDQEAIQRFVQLIKQAIYNKVREELVDDAEINIDPNPLSREYLKGNNGGVTYALIKIKNFGEDIAE